MSSTFASKPRRPARSARSRSRGARQPQAQPVEKGSAQHRTPFLRRAYALHWITILASGTAVLTVYVLTLAATVTAGDSGELITAAYTQGVAHPPGYPLWCLGAWLFSHLVPIGSVAYRMNLFSALFGALSAAVCTATLLRLDCRRAVAAVGGICLGFSKELWAESVIAEVYSMNLFFVGLLILVLLKWQHDPKPGRLVLFAGLLGLGMGNHHTLLAIGVVGAVWVAWQQPSLLRDGSLWLKVLGAFLAGLLVYVYLPIAASGHGYMNWGDPSTPGRFWAHLTRAQYPSDLEKPHSLVHTVGQLGWVNLSDGRRFSSSKGTSVKNGS
jgi:hypothetical protein